MIFKPAFVEWRATNLLNSPSCFHISSPSGVPHIIFAAYGTPRPFHPIVPSKGIPKFCGAVSRPVQEFPCTTHAHTNFLDSFSANAH